MCVAIPGKIISIDDGKAKVDFSGNVIEAYIGLVKARVGDYALVHAGCIIQTVKQQEAEEIAELMQGLE